MIAAFNEVQSSAALHFYKSGHNATGLPVLPLYKTIKGLQSTQSRGIEFVPIRLIKKAT